MAFEFDPAKSAANKVKHGIDFEEAQELWKDRGAIELQVTSHDEPRFVVIGRIAERHWAAVVTYREGNTRIISVRRARDNEIQDYQSQGL